MRRKGWFQLILVLCVLVFVGFVAYTATGSSNKFNRNEAISKSLIGFYSSRGGEYSYVEKDYFKIKNITAVSLDSKTVTLDVSILSSNPKKLYLNRSKILSIIRETIGKTNTVIYRKKSNIDNIKAIVIEEVFEATDIESELYFDNFYYF